MELFIGIIVFGIIWFVLVKLPEIKFNNRTPDSNHQTDWNAMTKDLNSGMSKHDVYAKSNRGGYDIPKKK